MTTFTSEYFIHKLAAIPAKNFIVSHLSSHNDTKHCTAGWLGGYISTETVALARLFIKHFAREIDDYEYFQELKDNPATIVYMVNDGDDTWGIKLKGTTPKERILRVLYQIRKKELQDGNIALAKQIVANPKSVSDAQKVTNKPKPRCFSNSY